MKYKIPSIDKYRLKRALLDLQAAAIAETRDEFDAYLDEVEAGLRLVQRQPKKG